MLTLCPALSVALGDPPSARPGDPPFTTGLKLARSVFSFPLPPTGLLFLAVAESVDMLAVEMLPLVGE